MYFNTDSKVYPPGDLNDNNSVDSAGSINESVKFMKGNSSAANSLNNAINSNSLFTSAQLDVKIQLENEKIAQANYRMMNDAGPSTAHEEIKFTRQQKFERFRLQIKQYMATSFVGQSYTLVLLIFSMLSPLQFIYQSYLLPTSVNYSSRIQVFNLIEMILAAIFTGDWLLAFFLADHKLSFMSSFFSMVDLMTVIPVWVTVFESCIDINSVKTFKDFGVYVLCGMVSTRIMRALRLRKWLMKIEDDVDRCLGEITLTVSVMMLFDAALLQYLEVTEQPYEFHVWVYFMWITTTTVGYGDISPVTEFGRVAIMGMIAFSIIQIPKMTNELIDKLNAESIYARQFYRPISKHSTHIICCGDMASSSLQEFFSELFHEDHNNTNLHVVILQLEQPNVDMKKIINDKLYTVSITYLQGSALVENDLKRAMADSAAAIFIMTNKFSAYPDEEDAKTILQQFSINRFIKSSELRLNVTCLMQLVRPENMRHLFGGDREGDEENTDLVVCLNEIKMGVIAKASIFPGCNTLIMNLLSSFAEDEEDEEEEEDVDQEIEDIDIENSGSWLEEYLRGCSWEIYTTKLAEYFEGLTFSSVSNWLYQRYGIVLFGLQIEDIFKDKSNIRVLLNPADYIIPSPGNLKIDAFVMAKDKKQSDLAYGVEGGSIILKDFIRSQRELNDGKKIISEFDEVANSVHIPEENTKKMAWQKLRSKFNANQGVGNFSQEEEMQKIRDLHMQDNYYLRSAPIDLADCIVRTSVFEDVPNIDNHIIIIGKSLSNLYDLIRPMRAKYLGRCQYIVIVYPGEIPHSVWQKINIFESILVVRGSSLEESDIRRSGIFKARQVVVLADAITDLDGSKDSSKMEALIDADAIFCYQSVQRMNEKARIVIEIVRQANVTYLDPESNTHDLDYKFTPQFAAGVLFTSSLLDTIVCQAFYNPHIIKVINKLVSGNDYLDIGEMNELYATSGSKNKTKGIAAIKGSCVYQINIPTDLETQTYGALYNYLSERSIIPIGIYRGIVPQMKVGPKGNKMCYAFTNPAKDTELFSCDKIFVLSQNPLKSGKLHNSNQELAEVERIFLQHLRSKKRSNEDYIQESNSQLLKLNEDIAAIQDCKFIIILLLFSNYDIILIFILYIANNQLKQKVGSLKLGMESNFGIIMKELRKKSDQSNRGYSKRI
jgi:hypothetical protein